eukprot:gene6732-8573_t
MAALRPDPRPLRSARARQGTPIRAAADGVVAYAGDQIGVYGGLILINHGGGWVSAYGHAARIDVQRGQAVRIGDVIGRAGATGQVQTERPGSKLKLHHRFQPLKRASKWPVWADVLARLSLAFFLIGIVVLVHWIDRAGLKDNYDGEISFLDVVYFTMISVTTTGFGDIHPVSDRSRLIEAVIVTPIRIMVLFIFVGTAYNFVLKRTWEKWRMARIQ